MHNERFLHFFFFCRAIKLSNVVKNVQTKNINLVDFWIEGTTQFNKDSGEMAQ